MSPKKQKKQRSQESKPQPELYVLLEGESDRYSGYRRERYARAHFRVKSDKYLYLEWREGEKIRSLYLGTRPRKRD